MITVGDTCSNMYIIFALKFLQPINLSHVSWLLGFCQGPIKGFLSLIFFTLPFANCFSLFKNYQSISTTVDCSGAGITTKLLSPLPSTYSNVVNVLLPLRFSLRFMFHTLLLYHSLPLFVAFLSQLFIFHTRTLFS